MPYPKLIPESIIIAVFIVTFLSTVLVVISSRLNKHWWYIDPFIGLTVTLMIILLCSSQLSQWLIWLLTFTTGVLWATLGKANKCPVSWFWAMSLVIGWFIIYWLGITFR